MTKSKRESTFLKKFRPGCKLYPLSSPPLHSVVDFFRPHSIEKEKGKETQQTKSFWESLHLTDDDIDHSFFSSSLKKNAAFLFFFSPCFFFSSKHFPRGHLNILTIVGLLPRFGELLPVSMNRKNQTLRYESIFDIQQKVQPKDAYLYIYLYFANNKKKEMAAFFSKETKIKNKK